MLPCPILGGELSNSAATSVDDIDEVMPCMRALGLNTVLVPAYWEFIEPKEGHFDFTLIDRTIDVARREHLAKAAREIHDMPLYVNAAMNSRGRRPGEYPSAGPLAHLIDFWHKGAAPSMVPKRGMSKPIIRVMRLMLYLIMYCQFWDKITQKKGKIFISDGK